MHCHNTVYGIVSPETFALQQINGYGVQMHSQTHVDAHGFKTLYTRLSIDYVITHMESVFHTVKIVLRNEF